MSRVLLIILSVVTTGLADPGDVIRRTRWRVEAIYSRSEFDVPLDASCWVKMTTHVFAVVQTESRGHPGIKRIVVEPSQGGIQGYTKETESLDRLLPGCRVFITVSAPLLSFKDAEANDSGDLFVDPQYVTVEISRKEIGQ